MIKDKEFWAMPHIKLPSSNIAMAVIYTHLMLRNVYSFPKSSCKEAAVSM